jgi:hypothetical protein
MGRKCDESDVVSDQENCDTVVALCCARIPEKDDGET